MRKNSRAIKPLIKPDQLMKPDKADELIEEARRWGLSDSDLMFCVRYTFHFNAAKAAIEAGHAPANANRLGFRLKNRPKVKAFITHMLKERILDKTETLAGVSDQARASIEDVMTIDAQGNAKLNMRKALETGAIRHIKEWSKTKKGVTIKMVDTQGAYELMMKAHGLDKLVVDVRSGNVFQRMREQLAKKDS